MAVEAEEDPVYLYCLNCTTWFEQGEHDHHTIHKDHNTITEEQVNLQGATLATLRADRQQPQNASEFYIDIPYKITETKDGPKKELPTTNIIGDAILEKFHFARIRDTPKELLIKENRVFRPNGGGGLF